MSELQELKATVERFDLRLNKHENKIETLLSEISESLQKISNVMIKQEAQEEAQKLDREEINDLREKYHKLDTKAALAEQSEGSIKDTAEEIKDSLKSALKWGAGIFASLIIVLIVAAIKAFSS